MWQIEVAGNSVYSLTNLGTGTRKAELRSFLAPPPLWEQFACRQYTFSSIFNTTEMLQLCPREGDLPESRQACG